MTPSGVSKSTEEVNPVKKHISLILTLIFVIALCACALAENQSTPGENGLIGRLSKLNITAEEMSATIQPDINGVVYSGFAFYDNLNSMLLALNNGDIAAFYIDENTARYIDARNEAFVSRKDPGSDSYKVFFSMLLREEDAALRDEVSDAIRDIREDGTLEALKRAYIDDCIAGTEPEAIVPEAIDGAGTIRVAVTGDRPPMDYINASGAPIGFNTALITEVARRLSMNVELVSVDSGSRAIALSTGVADIVFWMEGGDYNNWEGADREDQPEHTLATEPYMNFSARIVVPASSPLADQLDVE